MFANRENLPGLKQEHRMLVAHLDKEGIHVSHPSVFYSWCMQEAMGDAKVHSHHTSEYNALIRTAWTGHYVARCDWTHLPGPETEVVSTPLIVKMHDRKAQLDNLFDEITYDTRFSTEWKVWNMWGVAYGNLHPVKHEQGEVFVITQAHLVGMISAWFNTLLYSLMADGEYAGFSLYREVTANMSHVILYAACYPVDMYVVMKMWSSLCIGAVLRDNEDYTCS